MIQIIPAAQRRPSFSSQLGLALGTGLSTGIQQRMQQEASARQESAQYERELQKALMTEQLKQHGKMGVEQFKQKSKQEAQEREQKFLQDLFGNPQNAENVSEKPSETGFNAANIPDEAIAQAAAINPALATNLRAAKDSAIRQKQSDREFQEKQRKSSPEYKRETQLTEDQAKADSKYFQDLQSSFKQHKIKSQTLNRLEQLNKKGISGKPFEKLLEKSGLINLTSEGRREFAAEVKNLITDMRSILGSQFSQFEFQTVLNAYPSADFSEEANAAIIKNLKDFQEIRDKEYEIANQLKKENGGKLPPDIQSEVNNRLNDFINTKISGIKENINKIQSAQYGIRPGEILMFDPNGEPLSASPEDVENYLSLGATLP